MIMTKVTPEDDAFFGEELRREGMTLVTKYQKLENDRRYAWMNGHYKIKIKQQFT